METHGSIRPSVSPVRRMRRRWWQTALRAALAGMTALGAFYVALPRLLPAETIRRKLEHSLAEQLGTTVSIGTMRFAWSEGVVIDGLIIHNPPEFPRQPMIRIGRIVCDFSPLRFLLQRKISWMDVERLTVSVRDTPAGRLNVECLRRLRMEAETACLRVRQSEVSIFLHDQPRPLTARIGDLQLLHPRLDLGKITLTGAFEQAGAPAPIALRVVVGGEENLAAVVDCRFANLDLAQLPRSRAVWGDLPLESLGGRCGGQLLFELDRNLRVEEMRLELLAENLEVKPRGAEPLPVIDRAGLKLQAELDALNQRANIRRFRLRLPGAALEGSGVLYADLLRGDWNALDHFHLRGTVQPNRLLALLTGKEFFPNHWSIRGAVNLETVARQERDSLVLDLRLDGEPASIVAAGRTLKPARQPFQIQFRAAAQRGERTHRLFVEHARLTLGENTATVTGQIDDLKAFLAPGETSPSSGGQLSARLKALRGTRMQGTLDLKEPQTLWETFAPLPPDFPLPNGAWSGQWSLLPGSRPRISLGLRGEGISSSPAVPSRKPGREKTLSLELQAAIDPDHCCLTEGFFHLSAGRGRLCLKDFSLRPLDQENRLHVEGSFETERMEEWIDQLFLKGGLPWRLAGGATGTFQGTLDTKGNPTALRVRANLDNLAVAVGEAFSKPAGEKMHLEIQADGIPSPTPEISPWCASLLVRMDGATLQTDGRSQEDKVYLHGKADIQDLERLAALLPAARQFLAGGRVGGSLRCETVLRRNGPDIVYSLQADSKALDVLPGTTAPFLRLAGKRFALALRGTLREESPEILLGNAQETSLTLGNTTLRFPVVRWTLRRKRFSDAMAHRRPWEAMEELTARAELTGEAEELFGEIFPQGADWSKRHKLGGRFSSSGVLHIRPDALAIRLRVDGSDMAMESTEGFRKLPGRPATADMSLAAPRDLSDLHLRNLLVEVGPLRLEAQGRVRVAWDKTGSPFDLQLREANGTILLRDASALAEWQPALEDYHLGGGFQSVWRWSAKEGSTGGVVPEWTLTAKNLRGDYRGKTCRLNGSLRAEGLRAAENGKKLYFDRLTTNDLEFAAGENHGWLLADMQFAADSGPAGEFHLLLESLDDKDLSDWLSPPHPLPALTSAPASRTEADIALQTRADRLIAAVRAAFPRADVEGRVSAARYRTYDPNVGEFYPVRDLELLLRLRNHQFQVQYDAGLFGGRIAGRLQTDLSAEAPVVVSRTEFNDVQAVEAIQPQMSRMFPGNTVHGRFSRTEDVRFPLRDLLCNMMDKDYRLRPEGTAKMIATDGVVMGKAAPDFMTRLFPGLNLTKYPYRTMTAFTKFLPSGVMENETFFFGQYDLYMEGVTQPDFSIRYSVGLVLLGGAFPPEALRDWKQGRIPILKVKGRIENGKLADETVSYPLPNETLFEIFVRNNLVYRAWVNLQKKPSPSE